MAQVDLRQLVGKLNPLCRRSLEAAAGLCLSRTNYNVEVEHWLIKLAEIDGSDMAAVLRHFEINPSHFAADLTRAIDRFKTGNARPPALSPNLVQLVRDAWLIGSVDYGQPAVRSGHVLCALLADEASRYAAYSASRSLESISLEQLRRELADLTAQTEEAAQAVAAGPARVPGGPAPPTGPTKTPALDQYTIDLTAHARAGRIDPVLGRDAEIRQIIDILTRRRQNNPILTGEAGVGKTAVVEGFAVRVAGGDVPPSLQNVSIRTLDMGLLQAGAGVKGEFENRLKSVISEVKASPTPIILFIDEAHTIIGAGGAPGQSDAANLLKPALARGELRTIAATTWAEYKKYFEKDAALARRFQVVKVEEPDERSATEMIRGLTPTLESHHNVRILHEAIVDAVKLSNRYISGRQLPDKAVSLLDTTCARIGLSQSATPPAIEDARRRIEQLNVSMDILRRESRAGVDHSQQLAELEGERTVAEAELASLEERWGQEKELVAQIAQLRQQLEHDGSCSLSATTADSGHTDSARREAPARARRGSPDPAETADRRSPAQPTARALQGDLRSTPCAGSGDPRTAHTAPTATDDATTATLSADQIPELRQKLKQLDQQLRELQGEKPLVHPCVTSQAVAETVAAWTGIPVGRMVADEIHTVLNLKQLMEQSIIGQSHALDRIAQSIRTARANLADPRRPIGVFLLTGTSGVGKTETAITVAELLYGGEQNMTVLNMSEFKEEHKVSLLMGSPPGYVGYGEGGVLTEAVRRKPYSVVLLDEMEKAHPGVQDIFYQVFDKGTMKDGEGRDIDFKNTVIIMTTNAGTELIKSLCADPETAPAPDAFVQAIFPELLKTFKPAFLGRLTIIPFYPLSDEVMKQIIRLKLSKIARRVEDNYRAQFAYSPELVETIASRCTEVDTGARNVDHILTRTLLPEMSAEFLSRMADGLPITRVQVSIGPDERFLYQIQ